MGEILINDCVSRGPSLRAASSGAGDGRKEREGPLRKSCPAYIILHPGVKKNVWRACGGDEGNAGHRSGKEEPEAVTELVADPSEEAASVEPSVVR